MEFLTIVLRQICWQYNTVCTCIIITHHLLEIHQFPMEGLAALMEESQIYKNKGIKDKRTI